MENVFLYSFSWILLEKIFLLLLYKLTEVSMNSADGQRASAKEKINNERNLKKIVKKTKMAYIGYILVAYKHIWLRWMERKAKGLNDISVMYVDIEAFKKITPL